MLGNSFDFDRHWISVKIFNEWPQTACYLSSEARSVNGRFWAIRLRAAILSNVSDVAISRVSVFKSVLWIKEQITDLNHVHLEKNLEKNHQKSWKIPKKSKKSYEKNHMFRLHSLESSTVSRDAFKIIRQKKNDHKRWENNAGYKKKITPRSYIYKVVKIMLKFMQP